MQFRIFLVSCLFFYLCKPTQTLAQSHATAFIGQFEDARSTYQTDTLRPNQTEGHKQMGQIMRAFKSHYSVTVGGGERLYGGVYFYSVSADCERLVVADSKGYVELIHDKRERYCVVVYTHPSQDAHPWIGVGPKGRAFLAVYDLQRAIEN